MHDSRVEASITIASPASKVFDFLVTPQKIPLVLPGLVENYDIPELPLKEGSTFRYRYQMYGVMLEGNWTALKIDAPARYEAKTDGDVPSEWFYELTETGGSTHVKLEVRYQTPVSLAGKIRNDVLVKINQQESDHFLANLKTVLEMQA